MKWENWVKAQLRVYLCRQIDLDRIEKELRHLDNALNIPSQETPHRIGSVVEFSSIRDDKVKRLFKRQKELLTQQIKVIEKSLNTLTPFHRSLIDMTYLSLNYTDKKISEVLNLPEWAVKTHRRAALGHLRDSLINGYQKGNYACKAVRERV